MPKKSLLLALTLIVGFPVLSFAQVPALDPQALHTPNVGREGIVVAEEELAAKIGADILEQGGNAIDAAVATGFALAVTYPAAGNIGGGGFLVYYHAETEETIALDYRETAPATAHRDLYLDENGDVDNDRIRYSHQGAGIPGTVAGLLLIQERYGTLTRQQVLAPAIKLAEEGYPLRYYAVAGLEADKEHLTRDPDSAALFFKEDGGSYLPGEVWKNPDLANVLKAVSEHGRDGFYKGWVADAIADDMAANGGLITREDLANYEPKFREPVTGTYRGYTIVSMPPPSSGGVHLIQMLNMLETRSPYRSSGEDAEQLHLLAEIMRRAYADRAVHLGDPDYVSVPLDALISKDYANARVAEIESDRASLSSEVGEGDPAPYESHQTTHYSVIDRSGSMVANTYTLNLSYGTGIVVPGTGMLLNNEMDDFSAAPGQPNYFGLVGDEKNAILPGKRPLSSMTPTLVFKDGEPVMTVGSIGGSRIITSVLSVILNVIDRDMNIADAIVTPRIHHQWLPDKISFEPGLSEDTKLKLEAKGHTVEAFDWYARASGAIHLDGWFYGFADPRTPGGGACTPDAGC
ncbi:MAG: gamma-glutamyltransferase [Pseudomonadota bacterium]